MISSFIDGFIYYLHQMAQVMPLPLFTFVGAFIEEIIAPIPSPVVMTLAGSLAQSQGQVLYYLVWLALVGAIGKTIGSLILYIVIDKADNWFLAKFGKFLGISAKGVESIGKYFNKGWRDDLLLIVLRALPIIPTAPVSIGCGLIKLNLKTYLRGTFIGVLIRNLIYLYFGYTSVGALNSLNDGLDSMEKIGYGLFALSAVAAIGIFIAYRKSGNSLKFLERFSKEK